MLAAARQNTPAAFDELYRSLAPAVAAYVRAQGGDADDITSEVFLAVFSRIGSFQGDESQFRSWVFTIAHHRIVDARRRTARRPPPMSLEAEDRPETSTPPHPSAEDVAVGALGLDQMKAVLDGLAPDQRDVLVLRVIADLSVDQVAAALGKQPGAVKALQRRALAALRRQMAGRGVSL